MLASFAVDHQNFSNSVSHSNWYDMERERRGEGKRLRAFTLIQIRWMGEKYDGVRCCWNPEVHLLYLFFYL
jgi:hypothetical protein